MDQILREPEVLKIVKLSRSTVWRLEKAGLFPRRKRIGVRAVAWSLEEIQRWISSRPTAAGEE